MTRQEIVKAIEGLFEESCIDLLHSLNCEINRLTEPHCELDDAAPIAQIDAGSDDLELAMLLRVPMAVLALTYPDADKITAVDEEKLEDWISELSNQLIGRLKNKLLNHNCFLKLGLPNTYFGTPIAELLPQGFEYLLFYFDVDNETLECHLAIDVIHEDMSFTMNEGPDEDLNESELELF